MDSERKTTKFYFQSSLSAGLMSLILCMCLCQPALPISYESTSSTYSTIPSNPSWVKSVSLRISVIYPQEGTVLTNFPTNLEVKVTRGGLPEQDAIVQFWMMGGSHDAEMHSAFITITDSSGIARLTLRNQNTLESGPYIWYANAIKPGFRSGASEVISFINPGTSTKGISTLGGTVSTNKNEYSILSGNGTTVLIHGNVNSYHSGEPIVLKIESPSGKTVQLVGYGTYLGAFQTSYKLGQNSKLGLYTVTVYHNYILSSSSKFQVVK